MTTRELIDKWIEIQESIEFENNDEKIDELLKLKQELVNQMYEKVDNIDYAIVNIEKDIASLIAERDILMKEATRISKKAESLKRFKEYLNYNILPEIIKTIGKDNKLKTKTANYTLYQTWSSPIYDKNKIDREYIYIVQEEKVDVRQLKKDAIQAAKNNEQLPGVVITKVNRIRRS